MGVQGGGARLMGQVGGQGGCQGGVRGHLGGVLRNAGIKGIGNWKKV